MTLSSFKLEKIQIAISPQTIPTHTALLLHCIVWDFSKQVLWSQILWNCYSHLQECIKGCWWFQTCLCWGVRQSLLHKKWPVSTCSSFRNAHLVWKLCLKLQIFSSPVGNHLTIRADDPKSWSSLEFLHSAAVTRSVQKGFISALDKVGALRLINVTG